MVHSLVVKYRKSVKRRVPYGARLTDVNAPAKTAYVSPPDGYKVGGGTMRGYTQAGYSIALQLGLVRPPLRLVPR